MARPSSHVPWSGRSHFLLMHAVQDPAFCATMRTLGIDEGYMKNWVRDHDVPGTVRGKIRGILEDWAHANPRIAVRAP